MWLLFQFLLYFHVVWREINGNNKISAIAQVLICGAVAISQRQICYVFLGLSELALHNRDKESYQIFIILAHVSRIYSLLLIGNNIYLHLHMILFLFWDKRYLEILMRFILLSIWFDFIFELYSHQMIGWLLILIYHHHEPNDKAHDDGIYLLHLAMALSF